MVVFVGVLLAKGVYDAQQDKKKLISHLRHKYGEESTGLSSMQPSQATSRNIQRKGSLMISHGTI